MNDLEGDETRITFVANEAFYCLMNGLAYVMEKDLSAVIRNAVVLLDMAVKAELKGEPVEVNGKRIKVLP